MTDQNAKCLVSACLLGVECRFDGRSQSRPSVIDRFDHSDVLIVCPEVLGGLSVPRAPCERVGNKILSQSGIDYTAHFSKGAFLAFNLAKEHKVKRAILKSKSPMCGYGAIYDGTFSGQTKPGNGLLAELLESESIQIESID